MPNKYEEFDKINKGVDHIISQVKTDASFSAYSIHILGLLTKTFAHGLMGMIKELANIAYEISLLRVKL